MKNSNRNKNSKKHVSSFYSDMLHFVSANDKASESEKEISDTDSSVSKRLCVTLDGKSYKRLRAYSILSGRSMSDIISMLLKSFLEDSDALKPYDDAVNMMSKYF